MRIYSVAGLVACVVAAATLGACSSGQLPLNDNPAPRLPASSASTSDASLSVINFNPASPLALALNTTVNVSVSESDYSGSFKVVGCSAKLPVHCTPVRYGKACYENYTPDQINSISATMYSGSKTMTMTNYAAGTYFPAITCHFKIKDSIGNSATYTASSP